MGRVAKTVKVVKRRVTLSGNVDLDKVIAEMPNAFPGLEVHLWKKRAHKVKVAVDVLDTNSKFVETSVV